jgi:hypothetical protein
VKLFLGPKYERLYVPGMTEGEAIAAKNADARERAEMSSMGLEDGLSHHQRTMETISGLSVPAIVVTMVGEYLPR